MHIDHVISADSCQNLLKLIIEGKYRFKRKSQDKFPTLAEKLKKKKRGEKGEQRPLKPGPALKVYKKIKIDYDSLTTKKTEAMSIKKADYLMEREELNDEDLDIIVAQIEKEDGDAKEIGGALQYVYVTSKFIDFESLKKRKTRPTEQGSDSQQGRQS